MNKIKLSILLLCIGLAFAGCENSTNSNANSANINSRLVGSWHYSRYSTGWFDSALFVFKSDGNFTESSVYNLVGSYYQTVLSSGIWSATNDSLKITTLIANSTKDSGATWKSISISSSTSSMAYAIVSDSLFMINWNSDSLKADSLGFKAIK